MFCAENHFLFGYVARERGGNSYLLRLAFDELMISIVLNGEFCLDNVVMLQTRKEEAKTLERELAA